MAAEVMLVGIATVALEEGVKFLYEQAGNVLEAWRAQRRDPAAPPPDVVAAPAQVTVGIPQPSSAAPDAAAVVTLGDLRAAAERIANGQLSADDPAARATIAALREVVEAALGTSITFAGEAARPIQVSDVNVVANDVRGRLAGVDLGGVQGAAVKCVHVQVRDVEPGADVVGVKIGPGGHPDSNEPAMRERPIKILFFAANPVDTQRLRLDEEMRAIDGALRGAEFRDRFEIEQQWAVRIDDLQQALLRHQPDIVHFSGHGSESSEIVLQGASGAGQVVPPDALRQLFSELRNNIRCVVLNMCYSEQQAQAIADHIDCVVGMTYSVGDDAAIKFATGFYRAVAYGEDVQTAFNLGRNEINLHNLPDVDIPHLVAKMGDPKDISFVPTRSSRT